MTYVHVSCKVNVFTMLTVEFICRKTQPVETLFFLLEFVFK